MKGLRNPIINEAATLIPLTAAFPRMLTCSWTSQIFRKWSLHTSLPNTVERNAGSGPTCPDAHFKWHHVSLPRLRGCWSYTKHHRKRHLVPRGPLSEQSHFPWGGEVGAGLLLASCQASGPLNATAPDPAKWKGLWGRGQGLGRMDMLGCAREGT